VGRAAFKAVGARTNALGGFDSCLFRHRFPRRCRTGSVARARVSLRCESAILRRRECRRIDGLDSLGMHDRIFALLTRLLARIPSPLGYALADFLGFLHWACFPSRRRAARANVDAMLPRATVAERRRIVRAMMRSYTRMLFEFFRLPGLTDARLADGIEVLGLEHVRRALDRGHGVIVTSCHVGNWELGAIALARAGFRVNAVAGVQFGRWLAPRVRDAKAGLEVATIAPEDGFRKLWRALARNEIVALMVDGDIYSQGVACNFFGRPTSWPSGPGSLAIRTGALVVAGFCERVRRDRFRVVLEPPLLPGDFESADALNAAIAAATERHVAAHIDQWCIFRPFWPATPTTAPDPVAQATRVRA
jgi:lauroyl/myristoyl acyltransferase